MKKIIIIFLSIFLNMNKEVDLVKENYVSKDVLRYIEKASNEPLLSLEEILKHNVEIQKKTDKIYDLKQYEDLTKEEIKKMITSYTMPSLPRYDTRVITSLDVERILKNRNLENVQDGKGKNGIIVKKTNLKSFPTTLHFYNYINASNFDALQESELHVATMVKIVHESLDGNFLFVISPTYYGWVLKEDVAYLTEEDYEFFTQNKSFAIITAPVVSVLDTSLEMSVKLPLVGRSNTRLQLVMPVKKEDNFIERKVVTIPFAQAHIGYLPFTEKNIYLQSFRYLDTPYSWGSVNGVDCSSYIRNVFGTFGFVFPRNTTDQRNSVGVKIIPLSDMNIAEKRKIIRENPLSILYLNGHTVLYLGQIDGVDYIIHASGSSLKVVENSLDSTNYLSQFTYLNRMY